MTDPAKLSSRLRPATLALLARHGKKAQGGQLPLPGFEAPPAERVVLDTETTGFGAARLVELAAVHVREGEVVRVFQTLVQPEQAIPHRVIAVHGITDAMVAHAPTAGVVLSSFVAWAKGLPLWAHNASFDLGILRHECQRVGVAPPGLAVYCTLRLARKAFPEAPAHGLGALTGFLALHSQPAHRALADAYTARELLARCCEKLAGERPETVHGAPRWW